MAELLYRLGTFAARKAWVVILAWVVVLAIAVGGFLVGFKGLTSSFDVPGTASGEVTSELEEKLPDFSGAAGTVVFTTDDGSELTSSQQDAIGALIDDGSDLPDVATIVNPFDTEVQRAAQLQQLTDGRDQITAGRAQIEAGQQQLEQAHAGAEAAGAPDAQLAAIDAQLDGLTTSLAELEAQNEQLELGAELAELSSGIQMVSDNGSTALVNVAFTEARLELSEESKQAVITHFESQSIEGVEVSFSTDIAQGVPEIFGIGEVIGLIFAAIVLLVMLGSFAAAVLPLITALVGVAIGVVGVLAFSGVVQMASVTPVLGVMLGLAVGIDYSLFIVNRHRKQLRDGAPVSESIGLANGTAGNAVVFAGATVIVALLALNVTGIPFLGLMGTAGAVCVAIAVLIAITLTPALLGLLGERVLTKKTRASIQRATLGTSGEQTAEQKKAAAVKPMSTVRAILTTVVTIATLLVIAIPALSMRVGLPDGSSEPQESASYEAFTLTEEQFGAGATGTLLVTADLPEAVADEDVLATQVLIANAIADNDDVTAVAPIAVSDDSKLIAFQVIPGDGPNSLSTEQLVRDLRTMPELAGGITLGVAGQAAINIDISEGLADILPIYLLVVVGLSLIIMIMVFRSLLVPLIATGGFVLSLFATYGAIVAVFQWGWFAEIIGLTNPGPILSFLPVILVGILFGLAMDYQLFLASGMREAYIHGSNARLAVMQGFRAGRSVVIAAALIMISVFGGFIFSEATIIRSIGFGLAFGVLLDAFVVRMLLMPALMHLLGKSVWWLPRWLDRILPNVDVEGSALERRHHVV